jgi:hypothetical protein
MENAIFWNVMPCGSCENQCLGRTCHLHHQGENQWARNNVSSNQQFLVTANVPSLLIHFALMMAAICLSKTSVHTRATWHYIPEDSILHSPTVKTSNLTCLLYTNCTLRTFFFMHRFSLTKCCVSLHAPVLSFFLFYSLASSEHSLDSLCLSQWHSSHTVSAQISLCLFGYDICFAFSCILNFSLYNCYFFHWTAPCITNIIVINVITSDHLFIHIFLYLTFLCAPH